MGGVTTGAWIAIAAALAVLLVVLVVGSLLYRRRQISLKAPDTPQVTTAEKDRSGSYKADGGFNFSQGATATAPPREPVLPEPVLPEPVLPKPVLPKPVVIPE